MRSVLASVAIIAAVGAASCGGDDGEPSATDDNGDRLIAYVPVAPGAVEVERRVEGEVVSVVYETGTGLLGTTAFYDENMSTGGWRVTTYEVRQALGSAYLVFRNDEEKVIASASVATSGEKTRINLQIQPILERGSITEAPAETVAPSASESR